MQGISPRITFTAAGSDLLHVTFISFHKRNPLWHINSSRHDYLMRSSVLPAGRCWRSMTFLWFFLLFFFFLQQNWHIFMKCKKSCDWISEIQICSASFRAGPLLVARDASVTGSLCAPCKLAQTPRDVLVFCNCIAHFQSFVSGHWCKINVCRAPFSAVSASTQRTEWRWEFVYLLPLCVSLCDLEWFTPALWRLL